MNRTIPITKTLSGIPPLLTVLNAMEHCIMSKLSRKSPRTLTMT
jgi:hypothetical protein